METAPLKSFATSARTELIREVGARITAVLAQGAPERVEQPKAVAALERAIAGAGGGDKGRAHVADKVAYTWFNRIVALRFMDANGYTGIGVVSPAADQVGQPEVLAAAKRGQVDKDVVKGTNSAIITGLLNGSRQPRRGADAQAEAYALLLADYCRFWNAAMPFMFEREGDYTELLIPANLLADDSVLSRSVTVLSEDVCQDVEVIGWLYQFYISERKDEVFAGFKKNKKAGADEIPAATQLFTPHWIVRYLVENSLGRLWMLNRPASGLASQMEYYIAPVDEETDFLKISTPEELTVIDPACGSGHMLTYAFDLLYTIYEEEGYAPAEIPGLILAHNLHGTEIDPRAAALAAFALTMKARGKQRTFFSKKVEPNICVIDPISFGPDEIDFLTTRNGDRHAERAFWNQFAEADTFGSLIQVDGGLTARLARHVELLDHGGDVIFSEQTIPKAQHVVRQAEVLCTRYSVVVANPPYMGGGNMAAALSEFLKTTYPGSKQDLYGAFIIRATHLARSHAFIAMITGDTWMIIKTFAELRAFLLANTTFHSFVNLRDSAYHADTFGANAAFVLSNGHFGVESCVFVRLDSLDAEKKRAMLLDAVRDPSVSWRFEVQVDRFAEIPGSPIAYRLEEDLLGLFSNRGPLGDTVEIRAGISTGDNSRFIRYWHEVGHSRIGLGRSDAQPWKPHNKGGAYRKWYGNIEHVLKYSSNSVRQMQELPGFRHDGRDVYFAEHVSWSEVTSGRPSFRLYPEGMTFGSGSKAIVGDPDQLRSVLGYLNSTAVEELLAALSPGMKTEVGHVAGLPASGLGEHSTRVARLADRATHLARSDWDSSELSLGFTRFPLLTHGASRLADAVSAQAAARADLDVDLGLIEREIDDLVWGAIGRKLEPGDQAGGPAPGGTDQERLHRMAVEDLISYAVGCMFGRYSVDEPGLILADEGATLQDFLVKVSRPTFAADADNVIPIVDGDWFEDDVVGLFRQFLRTAFGEQCFEENLKFVTESLGVRNLRDYFVTRAGRSKFYDEHVQRYKKRPIYWLFSSPKGSFNALIYVHRYTPSTVSTVLTYLREYVTKLESSLQQADRAGNAKEADRLRKILVELNEYEHDTLYPKASENVAIDLDDGVKVNYPKFGNALKKITGLESSGG